MDTILVFIASAVTIFLAFFFGIRKKEEPVDEIEYIPTLPVPQPPPMPEPIPTPPAPKYLWDTPENARHSVRVICDEEGLSVPEKNLITAVIAGESGFKNKAKLENKKEGKVWSTDWGICQINDYFHIGPGKTFPSVKYVLENPDKVVRWMIKTYRAGHLDWWVAYKNGSYKKYL
jgi:hypothetical protein